MTALRPLPFSGSAAVADPQEAERVLAAHPELQFFDVYFTNLSGVPRGKRLRRSEIPGIFDFGRLLPSTVLSLDITGQDSLEGEALWSEGDADRVGRPVPGSLAPAPWLGPDMGQLMLSMFELDGRPNLLDPRHILSRIIARFAEAGLVPVVACELEFYLIDARRDGTGVPRPAPSPVTGEDPVTLDVYGLRRLEEHAAFLRALWAACDALRVPLEGAIAEYSPSQLELVLHHRPDALAAADDAVTYKRLVKSLALAHGFEATFMAKPWTERIGSGLHLHVSVNNAQGENIFASEDPAGAAPLRHALGGLKALLPESVAIFAPNANSYRRFKPHSYAPMTANWAVNNRTAALRIPAGPASGRHIEHRVAGADANPYLALAALLAGVHHGLTQKLDPGKPVEGNGYGAENAGPALPHHWHAALDLFERSEILKEYLGEAGFMTYAAIKRAEQARFSETVTALDYDWCLYNA